MLGSRVLFTADDAVRGRELWASDGASNGTTLVRDLLAGPWRPVDRRTRIVARRPVVRGLRRRRHRRGTVEDRRQRRGHRARRRRPSRHQQLVDPRVHGRGRSPVLGADIGRATSRSSRTAPKLARSRPAICIRRARRRRLGSPPPRGTVFLRGVHTVPRRRALAHRRHAQQHAKHPRPQSRHVHERAARTDSVRQRARLRRNDVDDGHRLWFSDGAAAGTRVIDVFPGGAGSSPRKLTVLGNRLFFTADGPKTGGAELWSSDGTIAGTSPAWPICNPVLAPHNQPSCRPKQRRAVLHRRRRRARASSPLRARRERPGPASSPTSVPARDRESCSGR